MAESKKIFYQCPFCSCGTEVRKDRQVRHIICSSCGRIFTKKSDHPQVPPDPDDKTDPATEYDVNRRPWKKIDQIIEMKKMISHFFYILFLLSLFSFAICIIMELIIGLNGGIRMEKTYTTLFFCAIGSLAISPIFLILGAIIDPSPVPQSSSLPKHDPVFDQVVTGATKIKDAFWGATLLLMLTHYIFGGRK